MGDDMDTPEPERDALYLAPEAVREVHERARKRELLATARGVDNPMIRHRMDRARGKV